MSGRNRREFLADVGRGMLVASVGSATALDLGLSPAWADDSGQRVTFGKLEPLVSVMQETTPDKLLPVLTEKLQRGTSLKTLISAGALANVRAFAGQDYTGFHTFMALIPALQMASEIRAFMPLTIALPAMALLRASQGQPEQAVELYALASRHPYVADSRWFEDLAGRPIDEVAATLPADTVAAARERGKGRDLWDTVADLLAEIEEGWCTCQ